MPTPGIYVIRNKANGKVYVGSSVNPKKRWREHRCNLRQGKHHAPLLQRAWNFRGEDGFHFVVIENLSSKAEMRDREQYWMEELYAYGSMGYNASPVAFRPSPETVAKGVKASAELRRGKSHSAESNLRRSLSQRGKPKGHGAKISATKKALGQGFTDVARANALAANVGKKHSAETRAKMSASHKARFSQLIEN